MFKIAIIFGIYMHICWALFWKYLSCTYKLLFGNVAHSIYTYNNNTADLYVELNIIQTTVQTNDINFPILHTDYKFKQTKNK